MPAARWLHSSARLSYENRSEIPRDVTPSHNTPYFCARFRVPPKKSVGEGIAPMRPMVINHIAKILSHFGRAPSAAQHG
jgi:hypothetical protein